MSEPTIANFLVHRFLDCWTQNGLDTTRTPNILGKHLQFLERPGYRVPVSAVSQAFDFTAKQLNDPIIGLKTGFHQLPSSIGVLGNLVNTAQNIRNMLKSCIRYLDLITQACACSYVEDHYGAYVRLSIRPGLPISTQQIDACIGTFLCFVRMVHGQPNYIAYFKHTPSADIQKSYRNFLGADVYFGHEFNGCYFPKEVLDTRISFMDNAIFDEQVKEVQRIYDQTDGTRNLKELVKSKILHACYYDQINLDQIADQLSMSTRTLQNKLRDFDTNFRELVETVRMEIITTMALEGCSSSDIAKMTGYSDTSTFHRAFKRTQSLTFQEFLQDLRGAASEVA